MKTINESPYDFFQQGGWSFLGGGGGEVRFPISFLGSLSVLSVSVFASDRATPRRNPTPSPSSRQTQRTSSLKRVVPRRASMMGRTRAMMREADRMTM